MKKKYLSILLLGTLLLHFGIGKAENSDQKLDSIFEIQDYVEYQVLNNLKQKRFSSYQRNFREKVPRWKHRWSPKYSWTNPPYSTRANKPDFS